MCVPSMEEFGRFQSRGLILYFVVFTSWALIMENGEREEEETSGRESERADDQRVRQKIVKEKDLVLEKREGVKEYRVGQEQHNSTGEGEEMAEEND